MSKLINAWTVLALLAVSSAANADMITYSQGFSLASTDWTSTFTLPKWDGSLGTLDAVGFSIEGTVFGNVYYENLDPTSAVVTSNLQALLTLTAPDNTTLVDVLPVVSQTETVAGFDGTVDFSGPSGRTYLGLTNSLVVTQAPSSAYVSTFLGTGDISLGVSALGTSNISGGGNIISKFETQASGLASVTYIYNPQVTPEPTSLAGLGLGIFGLGILRRRKRA